MKRSTDLVVIGGGIIGLSIAYQVARRHRQTKVMVLERASSLGMGSSGASSAILRCRYSHPEVAVLARDGQQIYRDWAEYTQISQPRQQMTQIGVLWLLGADQSTVKEEAGLLQGMDIPTLVLDPEHLSELFPALSDCGQPFDLTGQVPHHCAPMEAALFEEEGGYADPTAALGDLAEAVRREGADLQLGTEVTAVSVSGGKLRAVETNRGDIITSSLVINSAGPWANRINLLAGLELKWTLHPTRVQIVYRDWPRELGPIPVTGDGSTGIYFRPDARGARVLVGSITEDDEQETVNPDRYRVGIDQDFLEEKIASLHHRVPGLEHRGARQGITGLYTINRQDVHPVVGPTEIEGFWVANGFSGHGFKLAPAIGSMVAQAVTGEEASFDTDIPLSIFSVDREPFSMETKNVLA